MFHYVPLTLDIIILCGQGLFVFLCAYPRFATTLFSQKPQVTVYLPYKCPSEGSAGFHLCLHFLENSLAWIHFFLLGFFIPPARWNSLPLYSGSLSAAKKFMLCPSSQLKCVFIQISLEVSLFLLSLLGISIFSFSAVLRSVLPSLHQS